jgi:predicted transcriptional regulator
LDFHDIAARFLTAATPGISATRIAELVSTLRTDEVRSVLDLLLSKKLIEIDDSLVYWTTKEGTKFLDIHFNLERMLRAQTSLV